MNSPSTHPPSVVARTARRRRHDSGRTGLGLLLGVLALVALLAAAAWWMRPGARADTSTPSSLGGRAMSAPGMDLATSEPRADESLVPSIDAARSALQAEAAAALWAHVPLRPGAWDGRLVMLDGSPLPDDVTVSLSWSRPLPRVRRFPLSEAVEPVDPDETFRAEPDDETAAPTRLGPDILDEDTLRDATRTSVASDGTFRMTRVPRHTCWIRVEHDTLWAPDPPRLSAALDETTRPADDARVEPLLVRVEHGAILEGRVVTAAGEPVSQRTVSCRTPMDPFAIFDGLMTELRADAARTDADGTFRLGPLPARLALHVDVAGQRASKDAVVNVEPLAPRETRFLDVILPAAGQVAGVVLDEDERPVADARVVLTAADMAMASAGSSHREPETRERSGPDGRFHFTSVAPGSYRLVLAADDAIPARTERFDVHADTLRDDFVLTARRGLQVQGRVVDARGAAVPHALVLGARPPSMVDIGANLDRAYRSERPVDTEGRFVLAGFEPGDVRITASARGYVTSHVDVPAGTTDVVLTLGDEGSIAGIAMDLALGEPLTAYTLRVLSGDGSLDMSDMLSGGEAFREMKPPQRVEHPEGRFVIDGLRPGTYSLLLTADGFARVKRGDITVEPERTTSGIILMVPPEGRLTGVVVDEYTGAPLPGARVTTGRTDVMAALQSVMTGGAPRAETDADGRFVLAGLGAEPVTVTVTMTDYVSESAPAVMVRAGETYDLGVLSLSSGAALYGRIVDDLGAPSGGVPVLVADMLGRTMKRDSTDADGQWRIDGLSAGTYSVMRMDFQFDLGAMDDTSQYMDTLRMQQVTVAADEERRVDLGPVRGGTRLVGTVSSLDGPASSAMIIAQRQDEGGTPRFASADQQGRYELPDLPPGEYLVQVTGGIGGMNSGSQPTAATSEVVHVLAVPEQRLDLRLPRGVLEVRVTDESLAALDGVRVILERTDAGRTNSPILARLGHRVGEDYTRDGGRVAFRHLPPGTYAVSVGGRNLLGLGESGWAARRVDGVAVDEDRPSSVRVELRPGAGIEGTVTDARGRPLAGVPVWARDDAAGRWLSVLSETVTDQAGAFHLDGLEPGLWTLALGGTSHAFTLLAPTSVSRGGTVRRDVVLRDGVEVRLAHGPWNATDLVVGVSDASGPLPLELVSVDAIAGGWASGPGTRRLGRFAPGTYEVSVRAGGVVVHSGSHRLSLTDDPFTLSLGAEK